MDNLMRQNTSCKDL